MAEVAAGVSKKKKKIILFVILLTLINVYLWYHKIWV